MYNFIMKEMLKPITRRTGTALAALLVGQGFPVELVEQFMTVVTAMFLVGIDLAFSSKERKK